MIKTMELNDIDILSFLIAAICHDFKHDGFTNSYHVNARTRRAITYNDIAVQENFHVGQTFELLSDSAYCFTSVLSKEEN